MTREDFELLRVEIRFENEQVKGRFAGFAAFQSILVMGLAITQGNDNKLRDLFLIAIPVIGLLTAILGLASICAALNQIRKYRALINAYRNSPAENTPPEVGAVWYVHFLGSFYAVAGPLLFIVLWVGVLWWAGRPAWETFFSLFK